MEPIIENVSEITKETIYEAYKRVIRRKKILYDIWGWFMIILGLLSFLMFLPKINRSVGISIFFICLGLLILYSSIIGLRKQAKKTLQRMQVLANDKTVRMTIRFYENYLESGYNNGNKSTIQYNDLKKYYITKNLYILMARENILVMIRRDSFTRGTWEHARRLAFREKSYKVEY